MCYKYAPQRRDMALTAHSFQCLPPGLWAYTGFLFVRAIQNLPLETSLRFTLFDTRIPFGKQVGELL